MKKNNRYACCSVLRRSIYKAVVLVLCITGGYGIAQSQLVNGDFESACGRTTYEAFQAPTRCVTGSWFVSHGTPDIYRNQGGNATNAAHMWTNSGATVRGEGIFINCPSFANGSTYRVRFRLYSSEPPTNFIVALTNGLSHNTNTSSWVFPNVASTIVHNETNMPASTWVSVDFTFTPNSNFQQLWFYPRNNTSGSPYIYMDDVVITQIVCSTAAVYSNFSGSPAVTEVSDYIRAYNTSTVSTGQTVTFKAGNYVQLQPNFHAAPGSGFFHAYIAPCIEQDIQPCTDNVNGPIPKHGAGGEMEFGSSSLLPYAELVARGMLPLPEMGEELLSNYPNPFTGKTTIQYRVTGSAPVVLEVVNMFGERVAELLHNETRSAGVHSLEFDASVLPRGVYYLVLRSGTETVTKKMVVIP